MGRIHFVFLCSQISRQTVSVMKALILLQLIIVESRCSRRENDLINDLMRDYEAMERPVSNFSRAVEVSVAVHIMHLVDVDEMNDVIKAAYQFSMVK